MSAGAIAGLGLIAFAAVSFVAAMLLDRRIPPRSDHRP